MTGVNRSDAASETLRGVSAIARSPAIRLLRRCHA
jgi:hypothetical protein